jgi:DNA transposition AAA+ family ATPase
LFYWIHEISQNGFLSYEQSDRYFQRFEYIHGRSRFVADVVSSSGSSKITAVAAAAAKTIRTITTIIMPERHGSRIHQRGRN